MVPQAVPSAWGILFIEVYVIVLNLVIMKSLLAIVSFPLAFTIAQAQYLVKDDMWSQQQIIEGYYDVEPAVIYQNRFGITGQNAVKGSTLAEVWFRGGGLSRPEEVEGLQVSFYEKTDFGYYAVFDEKDYNVAEPKTILVIYNTNKKVTNKYLLSDAFANGRVCDFRYDNGLFFLALGNEARKTEFGYFSYQIYCFDIQGDRIVWKTDYEVCNKQFDVLHDYVVSGFGGTNREDYVILIDRATGVTLDKAQVATEPQYIEATRTQDTIYVVDYNSDVYRFLIKDRCVCVKGQGVRLRRGPSTSDEIFADENGKPIHPYYDDKLAYLGESGDFYKVRFMQQDLYISKRFSEICEGVPEKQQLVSLWQKQMQSVGNVIAAPVRTMFYDIDGDGIDECICKDNNDQVAVFTAKDQTYQLIVSDIMANLHIYPQAGALRTYLGLSTGYESESVYMLKQSELKEIYRCENGNYTKVVGSGQPVDIKKAEYDTQRSLLDKVQEEDMSSYFDL